MKSPVCTYNIYKTIHTNKLIQRAQERLIRSIGMASRSSGLTFATEATDSLARDRLVLRQETEQN